MKYKKLTKNILYHKLKKDYGSVRAGSIVLAVSIQIVTGRFYAPETIRQACYKTMGIRLALDIIKVIDFKLEDLRPDL